MDQQTAIKICKSSASGKDQLREALAWALSIEMPKKTNKADSSQFNRCKFIFMEEYERHTGLPYMFRAKDGAALAAIIKKIANIVTVPNDENVVENALKIIIQKLPEWYKVNAFSLPVIDSKFNQIITAIKFNGQSKQSVSPDYKSRVVGDLLS